MFVMETEPKWSVRCTMQHPMSTMLSTRSSEFWKQLMGSILKLIQALLITLHNILAEDQHKCIPYHTSALSGHQWVLELLCSHPECIQLQFGVQKEVFWMIITELRLLGHTDSKYVTLEEQLAIFLYMCVTGLTTQHVGEHFQHSNSTIFQ